MFAAAADTWRHLAAGRRGERDADLERGVLVDQLLLDVRQFLRPLHALLLQTVDGHAQLRLQQQNLGVGSAVKVEGSQGHGSMSAVEVRGEGRRGSRSWDQRHGSLSAVEVRGEVGTGVDVDSEGRCQTPCPREMARPEVKARGRGRRSRPGDYMPGVKDIGQMSGVRILVHAIVQTVSQTRDLTHVVLSPKIALLTSDGFRCGDSAFRAAAISLISVRESARSSVLPPGNRTHALTHTRTRTHLLLHVGGAGRLGKL